MELPENWPLFKGIVIEKIKTYCDSGIWPFQYEEFTSWLNNFDDDKEQYLALQILDSLVVRSNKMAKVSYARLFHGQTRQFLIRQSLIDNINIADWKNMLAHGGLQHKIRFCPVKKKDDEGESGSVIYRMISSDVDTNKYSYARSNSNPEVLILIDDFVGSGEQFKNFAAEFQLESKLKLYQVIYCPLIAYEEGLLELRQHFPSLELLPAEVILKSDSIFQEDENLLFKNDQLNTVGQVKAFFEGMHKKYAPGMDNWFGYNSACLPLAFEWGCPNQSPPILWMNYSKKYKWKKLFSRRA